ncbi:MAG: class I SAM-dependent methyltransferase [Lentisphaerae bacterium]|nr:class I SAM-dependent methyltransferase [Lentisphaerota bacterium]MCP4100252.1 class I SAM-dependent methyltransferase [Lentisphaerota bacterium]
MSVGSEQRKQCGRPVGEVGIEVGKRMNEHNEPLREWGLDKLEINPELNILDIGRGGGHAVKRLHELYPEAKISGLDHSADMINLTKEVNAEAVENGAVDLIEGTVSELPYPDEYFEFALAMKTVYFWPEMAADVAEVHRVLLPGGVLMILNEEYRTIKFAEKNETTEKESGGTIYSAGELEKFVMDAGFNSCEMRLDAAKNWLCLIAVK